MTTSGTLRFLAAVAALVLVSSCARFPARPAPPGPVVYAHYFNWFQTPDRGGTWKNWAWQGNGPKHDPGTLRPDGRRDIASVFYPLIGPYDSSDPDVIDYHIRSAKAAKIDGFFIDWYGVNSYEDSTLPLLLETGARHGFGFCVCFEDKAMFGYAYNVRSREEAVLNAISNLTYVLDTHATHPAYLRIDGKPVIINFSWSEPTIATYSQGFSPDEYRRILAAVKQRHDFTFIHDFHCHIRAQYGDVADNLYPWLDVNGDCLDRFYDEIARRTQSGQYPYVTTLVYPGFDNTGVWGWGSGPFVTPREDGAFYARSWERAMSNGVRFVQIATWNDFGEGATIEPTVEYGFQYLELTERFAARLKGIPSDPSGLRIPYEDFITRRKAHE
jgi:glycoprotein endo-alpha-1,2-mannosidase